MSRTGSTMAIVPWLVINIPVPEARKKLPHNTGNQGYYLPPAEEEPDDRRRNVREITIYLSGGRVEHCQSLYTACRIAGRTKVGGRSISVFDRRGYHLFPCGSLLWLDKFGIPPKTLLDKARRLQCAHSGSGS